MVACPHARHLPRRETYAARRRPLPCAPAEEDRWGTTREPRDRVSANFVVISASPTDRLGFGGVGLGVALVDPGVGACSREASGRKRRRAVALKTQRARRAHTSATGHVISQTRPTLSTFLIARNSRGAARPAWGRRGTTWDAVGRGGTRWDAVGPVGRVGCGGYAVGKYSNGCSFGTHPHPQHARTLPAWGGRLRR